MKHLTCLGRDESLLNGETITPKLFHHTDAVTCVSLRGRYLVSGGRDHRVILWACDQSGDWRMVSVFRGHEEILHFVAQDEDRWGHIGSCCVVTYSMFSGYTAVMTVASSSCGTREDP